MPTGDSIGVCACVCPEVRVKYTPAVAVDTLGAIYINIYLSALARGSWLATATKVLSVCVKRLNGAVVAKRSTPPPLLCDRSAINLVLLLRHSTLAGRSIGWWLRACEVNCIRNDLVNRDSYQPGVAPVCDNSLLSGETRFHRQSSCYLRALSLWVIHASF